jgi:hypothetical protein
MKNKLLIPVVFSLAWIGYKLVTFGLQVLQNPEDLFLSVMINIFCLLATVTFSLYFYKKTAGLETSRFVFIFLSLD